VIDPASALRGVSTSLSAKIDGWQQLRLRGATTGLEPAASGVTGR
jgi:hypothetical protein